MDLARSPLMDKIEQVVQLDMFLQTVHQQFQDFVRYTEADSTIKFEGVIFRGSFIDGSFEESESDLDFEVVVSDIPDKHMNQNFFRAINDERKIQEMLESYIDLDVSYVDCNGVIPIQEINQNSPEYFEWSGD